MRETTAKAKSFSPRAPDEVTWSMASVSSLHKALSGRSRSSWVAFSGRQRCQMSACLRRKLAGP
eukprot:2489290-Alexandrium_andersonii.AAC.1